MKRSLIVLAFVIALLIGGRPEPVHAALLPDCDRTVYYVKDQTKSEACTKDDTRGCIEGKGISPERYDELYPVENPAARKAHPPTVTTNRQCGFDDFIQLFINLSTYGLSILAVLGVAVVVWGGFGFLLAMGNQEKIKESKQTIWGGFLGTFIVLIAFIMVNWVVAMLTGNSEGYLFSGTSDQKKFYGEQCPTFKPCDKNNLHYEPGDGCKDAANNGNAVSKAQTLLTQLGCYTDTVDGCYGPITRQAVFDFQSRNRTFQQPAIAYGTLGSKDGRDDWQILEDAAAGAGGYLGCGADAPLTKTLTMSYGNNELFLSSVSATIKLNGTITWTNESSGTIEVQFGLPIKENGAAPSLSIESKRSASLTFPMLGTHNYTLSYGTDTLSGKINVVGQVDSAPSEQPPMP